MGWSGEKGWGIDGARTLGSFRITSNLLKKDLALNPQPKRCSHRLEDHSSWILGADVAASREACDAEVCRQYPTAHPVRGLALGVFPFAPRAVDEKRELTCVVESTHREDWCCLLAIGHPSHPCVRKSAGAKFGSLAF